MIYIPISIGELIDKLSILQIKKNKIHDEEKLQHINKEFELLYNLSAEFLNDINIEKIYHELVVTNSSLWEIEDRIRVLEKDQRFEGEFIEIARKVYLTNDRRFDLKNQINFLTSSEIVEVKDYVDYKNKN